MTSNRGAGHVGPLVPFAHALLRGGDEVLVAAPGRARPAVGRAGLPFHPLADPPQSAVDAAFSTVGALPPEAQSARFMREMFAGLDARTSLPGLLRLIGRYRPDVLLRDPTEFAGLLAAEHAGVPHGRVAIMAGATEGWVVPVVADVLDGLRRRLGLRPDPQRLRILDSPYLTVIPEAMEDPADPGPAHTLRFREVADAPSPPERWAGDGRPLVHVTYGSETPRLAHFPSLFATTVAALGELPVRALFTIGTDVDRAALGPVPPNVRVERWIPQTEVMPHAAAMVCHGGAGSTRIALAAGVPAVVVPGFADQFRNAATLARRAAAG